jgi:hypothetical protein
MFFYRLVTTFFLSTTIINNFTLPSNMIERREFLTENEDLLYSRINNLLPQGTFIISEEGSNNEKLVFKRDIDGDGHKEILAIYKLEKTENVVFLMVIKDTGGVLSIIDSVKGDGFNFDILSFSDVDGDEKEEILLGTTIGEQYRNLYVFKLKDSVVEKLFSTSYSKFEVIENGIYGNTTKQAVLALWYRDIEESFKIKTVRWNGMEFIEAKDVHKYYYVKVMNYYADKISKSPNCAHYWFYLAEAQSKCGLKKEALKSISQGVSLDQSYPSKQHFEDLKNSIIQ